VNSLAKKPFVPANERNNQKKKQDGPTNKNSLQKFSSFNFSIIFLLGVFVIGGIIIIALVRKKKCKD